MGFFSGLESIVRQGEPLAQHTWFKLGGPAEYFAEPTTLDQFQTLVKRCREHGLAVRILGGGSNLLIRDEGVHGLVVRLGEGELSSISIAGHTVTAGGGAKLGHVISTAVRESLGGLETLVGIPGTIGGALHGNAGSRGGDIGQWTTSATVLTRSGELIERKRDELVFAYRESSLDELAIVQAQFTLEPDDSEKLTKRMQKQWIVKKASQPMSHQSAGCIFKNPRGMHAGMLIEQAGMKGTQVGGAEVSQQHANFIITNNDAKSSDVLQLIELVRERVSERLGVKLETEIEFW